ncbi:threonine--tRNA ligase [Cohnella zeiphila]|uniref:Threonine--tRNA ligase n=1 Tax=Cohnella zeiphila TaxID=2761120 RepID=A0A7X0SHM4_9BACL|nr:threonine--tRNA ligase [Cohnella zeiphila]MBB6730144.1 threonine--tRNA ligase [Cohnella zeiphila]
MSKSEDMSRLQAAQLLAQAVQRKFEGAKLGGGALTAQGFACDFDVPRPLTEEDLAALEDEMRRIASAGAPAAVRRMPREEAVRLFEARGEPWKTELLHEGEASDEVAIYEREEFADVWPDDGLRPEAAAAPPAFRLLHAAGAYWRGDSRNPVLQRVHGVAFAGSAELDAWLARHEEAQKRDHRKLGKQLELFMFAEEAPGMPFYLPKGAVVRQELENLARRFLRKYGYEEVRTPFLMDRQMWEQSGHWEHYRDNMYFSELEDRHWAVKPMNCPGHMLLFRSSLRSYRDLPIRLAEFGQVHRHEFSGALNGLFRVRTFCQDDAHIFVRPDQIEQEMLRTIALIREMYDLFGFDYAVELSTRPADSMGSDEQWKAAEAALAKVLEESGLAFRINPGDGAFYGPKIDFHIKDALERSHQCGTIQLDFQMPEKFGLSYVDEKNEKRTPIVIHRAVYGSIDRFFGILIEHFAGAFPVWLAPVQVTVLPVSEQHAAYGEEVCEALRSVGVRAAMDSRNEKLGYRVREAQLQKIPYLAVVGDAEQAARSVQVRARGEQRRQSFGLEEFRSRLLAEIRIGD